jgi:hypothetical protein
MIQDRAETPLAVLEFLFFDSLIRQSDLRETPRPRPYPGQHLASHSFQSTPDITQGILGKQAMTHLIIHHRIVYNDPIMSSPVLIRR